MRRSKADAEQTRISIMDAAERVFVERGIGLTTLEQIARAAGVTRGAVYWHFSCKTDLLEAMRERYRPPQVELLEAAADSHEDPLGLLETISCDILLQFETDESRQRMFVILSNHIPFECGANWQETCNTAMFELLEQLMTRARDTGTLVETLSPCEAAVSLMIATNGLLSEWLRCGKAFPLGDLGVRLMRRHIHALRKPA